MAHRKVSHQLVGAGSARQSRNSEVGEVEEGFLKLPLLKLKDFRLATASTNCECRNQCEHPFRVLFKEFDPRNEAVNQQSRLPSANH